MARSNKYTPLNFNGILEKKLNNNSQPATNNNSSAKSFTSSNSANQSKTVLTNSRIHGRMLVLSRPSPKPISIPQKTENLEKPSPPPSLSPPNRPQTINEHDTISLRPQGRTGSGPVLNLSPSRSPVPPLPAAVKSDRFVPPHLRPGFSGREEKPGPGVVKGGSVVSKLRPESRGHRPGQIQGPGVYGSETIDERPKSGGGYERTRRGCEPADLNRPGSSGTRPSSSG